MMFGQDRRQLRQMYADAWRKAREGTPMSPLEQQIAAVIADHPEYHALLESDDLDADYTPEGGQANPFLHMGLHLAIRDQVATNRPAGIGDVFRRLAARLSDPLAAEHQMIEVLAETLWQSQRNNAPLDESQYLAALKRL